MDLHLQDKSAVVTGSTAGIGLEIARKLAVEGAKVIITGRNKEKLDQAVDSIRTELLPSVLPRVCIERTFDVDKVLMIEIQRYHIELAFERIRARPDRN